MNYWDSVGRWINTLLLFIVGVIAFDTLFRLLEAQESNLIVSVVRILATLILVPFEGMFSEQRYEMTALMGILGYCVLVGIALAVLRSLQATRAPRQRVYEPPPEPRPAAERDRVLRRDRPQPVRPADAAQPTAAQRAPARRASKRPDPPPTPTPAPAAKPPTRTPARRATAQRPASEGTDGNGRPATGRDDAPASPAGAPAANGADGTDGTPARPTAASGDHPERRAASSVTDTTDNSSDKATATPAAARAATDTTSPRDTKPRDGDPSDDRPR
jgi:hypothetical protein